MTVHRLFLTATGRARYRGDSPRMYGHRVIAVGRPAIDNAAIRAILLGGSRIGGYQ
jgi:hypothetical protein